MKWQTIETLLLVACFMLWAWCMIRLYQRRMRGDKLPDYLVIEPEDVHLYPSDELVAVAQFRDSLIAELWKTRLESEGIESAIIGAIAPQHAVVELKVRAEDVVRAVEVLRVG